MAIDDLSITWTSLIPTITGAATATAFTTTYGTASTAQGFSVSGSNLTANLVATAQTGFEVATTENGTYGTSVTFTQSGGSANGTVWIRLKADATAASSYNNITAVALTSTGATAANIITAGSGNSVSKATPSLSITSANTATAGDSVSLTATSAPASGAVSASTGAITYASDNTGVVSIASTTASAVAAGTATITATQAADANYNQGTATQSFTVTALSGSITPSTNSLTGLPSTTYGTPSSAASFDVSGSGLTGNLTVSAPTGFEVSTSETGSYGSSLSLTATDGSVALTTIYVRLAGTTSPGSYSGNISISGGSATTQNVAIASSTMTKANQTAVGGSFVSSTITFGQAGSVTGSGGSGTGAYELRSVVGGSAVVIFSGTTINVTTAGTADIEIRRLGDTNYNDSDWASVGTLTINKADQTISGVAATMTKTFGNAAYSLGATVNSGLTISYSSDNTAVATVSTAGLITIVGAGSANITASQTGNDNYNAATPATQALTVGKANQTITFGALISKTTADVPFALTGTTTAVGLTVGYTSSNPSVATVSGNTVTIVGVGTTTITASQPGNDNYNAATSVSRSLSVTGVLSLTEIFVPQTIQGGMSSNSKRTPYIFRATLNGLLPNATYRYFTGAITNSDAATSTGAGLPIFITSSGNFSRATSGSLNTAGSYAELTTDSIGTYTGWFGLEPSSNARFQTAGTALQFRITLNDGNNGTTAATYLTTSSSATVTAYATTGSNAGTGIYGLSAASPMNLVLLYDNTAGTGRPIAGAFVESDGVDNSSNYPAFYVNNVNTVAGAWGTIIPNALANGIRRIENRSRADGSLVAVNTDSDGVWPSAANTVNPNGGDTTVRVLTIGDARLGPEISSSGTLSALSSTYGVASSATSFSLQGSNLTTGVTVTPPPGFEVSTTSNFSLNVGDADSPLDVGAAGTISATDVYVRLKANALPGSYSGNIVLTSTGATQVNVATVPSTMGYASIDGTSLGFSFPGATPANRVTEFIGWTSNNPQGSDGFTYINGDTNNPIPYIGNWISTTPNVELAYQFSRGGSEKIVFIWEQQITESSIDFPGVDSFGWAFRNGSTTLFSLRFLPEQVAVTDPPVGTDWDENGVLAAPNKLVAVAFLGDDLPSGGPGAGPLDQVNFATFDRGQTVKFRITIDLEAKSWSADVDQAGTWFGLVIESALPAGITSVDRMVALWDIQNTTLSTGNLYESGGDNLMLFDNFAVAGSDLARTPVTLTLAAPTAPVTYDGSGKAATATANPNVAFEISYWDTTSTNSTTAAPVNAGTYTAKVTVVDEVTYAATPQYVTYTIAPKPVTVSNVSANDKEYDGNTSATLNTTGADIVGRVGVDDVNLAGTASGVFTDKNVGTNIPVTVTGFTLTGTAAGNYSLTQPIPDADITAREVTVLGAVANSKTYDRTNTATVNLTGASLVGVISPDVVTVSGGGTFVSIDAGPMIPVTANLSLGGANAGNYTLSQPTYLAADIDVRTLTIPDAQAQDKVYDGSTDAVITGTLTGVLEGDTVTVGGGGQFDSSDAGVGIAVTSYLLLEGGSAGNYSLTQPTGLTANINPQPISVTLNPPASFTYDGISKDYLVDSPGAIADVTYEGQNPTVYGPTPSAPVNAGNYTVTATVSDPNYSGTATANFTIDPASLTVTADPQSKIYGETDPLLSYLPTGLVPGDALTGSLTRAEGENVGEYDINQGTLDAGPNYTISYTGAKLTITKKDLLIAAENKNKTYGNPDPALTYLDSGLVGSDSITGSLTRDSGEGVGTYTIKQGSLSAGSNYTINFTSGSLEIEARQLTITADPQSKTYGDTDPSLTYNSSGLVEGDSISGALARDPGEDVGSYDITQGTIGAGANYFILYTPDVLTISAKAVTVTADPKSKTYGELDPELTYSVTGLVGSDTLLGSLVRATGDDAGVYAINQGTLGSLNYDITFVSANFTINKANQTISGVAATMTKNVGDSSYSVGGTATSGLGLSYSSSNTGVATVNASTGEVTIVAAGITTITVSQGGNTNYNAATSVTQALTVNSSDGPWDIWADSYSMANGTERAKSSDPDGDGFNNALEFAFGTHPTNRNAEIFLSHARVVTNSTTNYVVTFKKRKDTNEVTYDIRSSSDLKLAFTNGSTMILGTATGVDANYEQTSVNLPISTNRGFVRMQATVKVEPSR